MTYDEDACKKMPLEHLYTLEFHISRLINDISRLRELMRA